MTPAQAEAPIDLELDAAGSSAWNISVVKPGDSGTKTIELHNIGGMSGIVYIWISDISNTEGVNPEAESGNTGEPGELGNHVKLSVSSAGLTTNVILPATVNDFPQSAPGQRFIRLPLAAGATATAVWEWSFPDTGVPQNDAQGDSLTFSINYWLTEPLPEDEEEEGGEPGPGSMPVPAPLTRQMKIDIMGTVAIADLGNSGEFLEAVAVADAGKKYRVVIEAGTIIRGLDASDISGIEMRAYSGNMTPPEGSAVIGMVCEVIGYTVDSLLTPISFSRPMKLMITYDPGQIPEGAKSIGIAFLEADGGWRTTEEAASIQKPWSVTGAIYNSAPFAILAGPSSPQSTAPATTLPGEKEGEQKAIPPGTALPGEKTETPASPGEGPVTIPSITAADETKTTRWQGDLAAAVAVAGVSTMTVLGVIQRRRRNRG
ncbi:MAG: hypothetical protein A2Z29_10750 [Chloroflexi bacterium RBG_16_56_11]|nr:MAG: hypothetical protein A2Z29_10750 [Chloroflexi bacterium RBG_16_56_11]